MTVVVFLLAQYYHTLESV